MTFMESRKGTLNLSLIVPLLNEEDNVRPLYSEVVSALDSLGAAWELLLVDDRSSDHTFANAREIAARDPRVRAVRLMRSYGQTAALQVGFRLARGEIFVTMDGDLQNDPRDIRHLLDALENGGEVACGWRKSRRDSALLRRLPSWAANRLIMRLTGTTVHDSGCGLRAYRRSAVAKLRLFGDMHRYLPVILGRSGSTCTEVVVGHRSRRSGRSKYGVGRVWRVALDALALTMTVRFAFRPALWFGLLGLPFLFFGLLFAAGSVMIPYLTPDDTSVPIVLPAAALLSSFGFLNLLILGAVGELVVWNSDDGVVVDPLSTATSTI